MATIKRMPTPAYTNPDRSKTPTIDALIPLGSIVLPGEKVIEANPLDTLHNRALLRIATQTQAAYWDAVRELELALGVEIDDLDFSTVSTIPDVITFCEAMAEA